MNQKRARDLGFYVLLIVIMIAVIFTMTQSSDAKKVKTYSDLVDLFNDKIPATPLSVGQHVEVYFGVRTREYNGKVYNDVNVFKFN